MIKINVTINANKRDKLPVAANLSDSSARIKNRGIVGGDHKSFTLV